ncbi:MAG TPA: tripartite tricarboxylate transporter TctB family protein [Kiloniellales bacterium]|nr:tripartite tricarboxylate transporter TctB family protein [Kiloniellales bacterium]
MSDDARSGGSAATPPQQADVKTKPIGGDLIIPAAGIIFVLYYFSTILDSPWTAQVSAFFVGGILMMLSVILFVRSAIELRLGHAELNFERILAPRSFVRRRLILLGLALVYIYVVHWGGFTLTTFAFLVIGMLLLRNGRNVRLILGLSAAIAVAGYLLFIVAFQTRFPRGPFEWMMSGIL